MRLSSAVFLGVCVLVLSVQLARAVDCPKGKYQNATAACVDCPAGTIKWTVDNSTQCTPCPVDTYQYQEGFDQCYACPTGATTNGVGKDTASACVCPDDQYLATICSSPNVCNWECVVCPAGIECTKTPENTQVAIQDGEDWLREGNLQTGRYMLQSCKEGHLLVNNTYEAQVCERCAMNTYSVHDLDGCTDPAAGCPSRSCNECPAGASCTGGENGFTPGATASEWEEVVINGYHVKRIAKCPKDFVLIRNPSNPLLDECVVCDEVSPCTRCAPEFPDVMSASAPGNGQQLCAKCTGCPDEIKDVLPGSGAGPTTSLSLLLSAFVASLALTFATAR